MGRRKARASQSDAPPTRPARAEQFALFVLLALIPLRATINETHTLEVPRMFREIAATQAHPGYTLLFSFLIIGIGLWRWLSRTARFSRNWLPTGGELGFVVLVIATTIAFIQAGQKHLALTGGINLLGAIVYGFTLRSLLSSPARVRLTCYVLIATGVMLAVKGGLQHLIEHPNTLTFFEENKEDLLKNSLYSEGMLHDYEQRLRSAELSGYYPHSNVYGSHMILLLMATLAPVMDRLRRNVSRLTLLIPILAFGMLAAIVFLGTGKGPIIGATAAVVTFAVGALGAKLLTRFRFVTWALAWLVALGGVAGVGMILQKDEAALGRSLQFRHMYWRGAAALVEDRGLLGVGPLNFGRHFTQYKPVECPEEVESPHSWIVQLLTEWGLLGLIGFSLMLLGMSWRVARLSDSPDAVLEDTHRSARPDDIDAPTDRSRRPLETKRNEATPNMVYWSVALGALLFLLLAQHYSTNAYLLLVYLGLGLVLPFLLGLLMTAIETNDNPEISNTELGAMAVPLFAGAVGFLVHTAIDLALFEGGPATTFFAMIAAGFAALSLRQRADDPENTSPLPSILQSRVAVIVGLAIVTGGVVLFNRAGNYQRDLSIARRNPVGTRIWRTYMKQPQALAYQAAHRRYSLDATSLSEWVEQLIPRARTIGQFDTALAAVDTHQQRDPFNALGHNLKGTLLRGRFEVSENIDDLKQAAGEYEMFLATYPTNPDRHIYLANVLLQLADAAQHPEFRTRAVQHLRRALELEGQRVYVSQPNRKSAEEIQQLEQLIQQLETLNQATSQPAVE